MPFIAIDGPSGVGKSLIAKQLSAVSRWPVIMEGEVGALPDWVLHSFTNLSQAQARTTWHTGRCALACQHATDIGQGDRYCFLDSGPLTHEAYLRVDARTAQLDVKAQVSALRRYRPTLSVLFLDSESTITERIRQRARPGEDSSGVIRRVLDVQQECRVLAMEYPSIVIHRIKEDYLRAEDLTRLWQHIQRELYPRRHHPHDGQ